MPRVALQHGVRAVAFYITLIALVNISLGFGAAAYLARKHVLPGNPVIPVDPSFPAALFDPNVEEEFAERDTERRPEEDGVTAEPTSERRPPMPDEEPLGGELPPGFLDRTGLETELSQIWGEDAQRVRQLAVAMLDVDQFGRINERFGREMGDRLLSMITQLIVAEGRGQATLGRLSGQRFVVLFPDADIRLAIGVAERVRQTIAITHFQYHEFDAQVTLSCALTAAAPDDTPESLFGRVEAALLEAKRYGRNRTFVHEGHYPTPVVPPNLAIQDRSVVL